MPNLLDFYIFSLKIRNKDEAKLDATWMQIGCDDFETSNISAVFLDYRVFFFPHFVPLSFPFKSSIVRSNFMLISCDLPCKPIL